MMHISLTVEYDQWPGYRSFSKQKNAYRKTEVQNRAKIAAQIAEVIMQFMRVSLPCPSPSTCPSWRLRQQEQAHLLPSDPALTGWRVGSDLIELQHIYLLEIRQVSKASWQPVLAVKQPMADPAYHPDINPAEFWFV